jgi:hypothetical protein
MSPPLALVRVDRRGPATWFTIDLPPRDAKVAQDVARTLDAALVVGCVPRKRATRYPAIVTAGVLRTVLKIPTDVGAEVVWGIQDAVAGRLKSRGYAVTTVEPAVSTAPTAKAPARGIVRVGATALPPNGQPLRHVPPAWLAPKGPWQDIPVRGLLPAPAPTPRVPPVVPTPAAPHAPSPSVTPGRLTRAQRAALKKKGPSRRFACDDPLVGRALAGQRGGVVTRCATPSRARPGAWQLEVGGRLLPRASVVARLFRQDGRACLAAKGRVLDVELLPPAAHRRR